MLIRTLSLIMILGLPAVAVSQTPSVVAPAAASPRPVASGQSRGTHLLEAARHLQAAGLSDEADRFRALAEELHRAEQELQGLIISRDALTKEIERLRRITGQQQQIVTSVKVCELSLTKARKARINVGGVELEWLHANGFGGALSAGVFDDPRHVQAASLPSSEGNTLHTRIIENDESLRTIVAGLQKAGVLKVLAEPALATISGRPAAFHLGGEFPIPVAQSNGDSTIEFKEFGTRLDLVPVVLGHGMIRLELRPTISEIDSDSSVVLGNLTVPGLRVRGVDTAVEMRVGQTLVLAGLVQQRAIKRAAEESTEAEIDTEPRPVPGEASEGHAASDRAAMEESELIVLVRAEFLEAPKAVRRADAAQYLNSSPIEVFGIDSDR